MAIDELLGWGERYHQAVNVSLSLPTVVEWIIDSPQAEVYSVPDIGDFEPGFLMVTDDNVLVRFAPTGEMTGMNKITGSGLENVVEMDSQYRFHLHRNSLPVNGIFDNTSLAPEQILEYLIDYAYRKAKAAKDTGVKKDKAKYFEVLTHEAIVSRFKLLQTMQSPSDIIPDQSPTTIFVKAGDGCPYSCVYCPESITHFRPYTVNEFEENIKKIKDALTSILKSGNNTVPLEAIVEGFINISDILLLDIYNARGKTDLDSKTAVRLMRQHFPHLTKIGSFVGTRSALDLSEELGVTTYNAGGRYYSSRFFEGLRNEGLNRLYIGIETGHDQGSMLLRKPVTYEQKLTAAKLIQSANIRLKAIVQIGVFGKGFYPRGKEITPANFVPSEEAIRETARWLNEASPYRVYISVWQNYHNLEINNLIREGKIVPYENPAQIEAEKNLLRSLLRISGNGKNRVETEYENFLPGEKRLVIPHI